jgi:NAD(P)H-flavin reductase
MTILSTTTLSKLRKYSYRTFYITHLVVALTMPPITWFHVPHSRVFMAEGFFIFLVDLLIRRCCRFTASATIDFVPGTDLVKIVAAIPSRKLTQFAERPASHVYLSIPRKSRPGRNAFSLSNLRFEFLSNPFTVALVDEEAGTLTLVARQMKGPVTAALSRLASLQAPGCKVVLNIDGPYGAAANYPILVGTSFDKILLVAGGVGATFIMPLYESIATESAAVQVEVLWAVRDAAEVTWPILATKGDVQDDERIRTFVTVGIEEPDEVAVTSSEEYEDVELNRLGKENERVTTVPVENHKRPDFQRIMDDLCRQDAYDRVAVIVCGPEQMARDSRKAVGTWVKRKRNIWFHSESFGW